MSVDPNLVKYVGIISKPDKFRIQTIDINELTEDLCLHFLNSLGNILRNTNNTYSQIMEYKGSTNIRNIINTINKKTNDTVKEKNLTISVDNLSALYRRALLYYLSAKKSFTNVDFFNTVKQIYELINPQNVVQGTVQVFDQLDSEASNQGDQQMEPTVSGVASITTGDENASEPEKSSLAKIAKTVLDQIMIKLKNKQDEFNKQVENVIDKLESKALSSNNPKLVQEVKEIKNEVRSVSQPNENFGPAYPVTELRKIADKLNANDPETQSIVETINHLQIQSQSIEGFTLSVILELFVSNNVLFLNSSQLSFIPDVQLLQENIYVPFEDLDNQMFEQIINVQLKNDLSKYTNSYYNTTTDNQTPTGIQEYLSITEKLIVKKDNNGKLKLYINVFLAEMPQNGKQLTDPIPINNTNAEQTIQTKLDESIENDPIPNPNQIYKSLSEAYNNSQPAPINQMNSGGYKRSKKTKKHKNKSKVNRKRISKKNKNKKTNKRKYRKTRR